MISKFKMAAKTKNGRRNQLILYKHTMSTVKYKFKQKTCQLIYQHINKRRTTFENAPLRPISHPHPPTTHIQTLIYMNLHFYDDFI